MEFIALLATPAAIIALVNLAREFGMPKTWAMALAVVLGVGLALADYFLGSFGWYGAVTTGLMLGLSAAGLHDLAGRAATPAPQVTDDA